MVTLTRKKLCLFFFVCSALYSIISRNALCVQTKNELPKKEQDIPTPLPKKPLWSRRRPLMSQPNERSEGVASVCNSFKDINKLRETTENLNIQLKLEEIEFKRKLHDLQLQAAIKDLEIKNEILLQIRENAIMEFARRRVHLLLRDVERMVRTRAGAIFFQNYRPMPKKSGEKPPRWSVQVASELARQYVEGPSGSIAFGEVEHIAPESFTEQEMKSVKDRPPTPVPSKTKLAEVTFLDRVEDLPDPIALGGYMPERKNLLQMINTAAKLISRSVSSRVQRGMDITVGKVTLPHLRHAMEWGEGVEGLAVATACTASERTCGESKILASNKKLG